MIYFQVTTARSAYKEPSRRSHTSMFSRTKERRAELILLTALAMNVLEGSIRKWVIVSQGNPLNHIAYFSKDIIFAMILFFQVGAVAIQVLYIFRSWFFPGCIFICFGDF